MGLALVEMLRCMADKGILEMRDDCEFRSVGLRVSWLGVAVAAEVASLVGGAAGAAVCRRCIRCPGGPCPAWCSLNRAGQGDAGRAGRRGAWQATEPVAPATPCPLRSGRDPAAPGRLPASCIQSAPRGAPPLLLSHRRVPSRIRRSAHRRIRQAPWERCPAGPAGIGRTFSPGDTATSAPPIVLLVKCGSRRRTITD